MFGLIVKLLEFQKMIGINLRELLAFFKAFSELGPPPAIDAEQSLRGWLVRMVAIVRAVAAETPTTYDDDGVEMFDQFLASDQAWGIAYKLLTLAFGRGADEIGATAEEESLAGELSAAMATGDKVGFSPALILMMIQTVVTIIQFLRDRRDA